MKKVILSLIGALFLVGCGSDISNQALENVGLKGAPKWVIEGSDGLYSGIGDAPIVNGDINFARTEALASARAEVAKQIEVKITSFLSKQTNRSNDQKDDEVVQQIKEATEKDLIDTKPSGFWIPDNGSRVYVLLKLSEKAVRQIRQKLKDQQIDINALEASANKKKSE